MILGALKLRHEVGAPLLLSANGIRMKLTSIGIENLLPKWIGPFTCTERVGNLTYRLELRESLKIYDVFHVSLLKPYHENLRCVSCFPA